jgi:hypothetical protein
MPTQAALAPNERPLMLRDDDVVIALSEYLRSQREL